MKISRFL